MGKNNAQSLKIPSASAIKKLIQEEVEKQVEERMKEMRRPNPEFMEGPMGEMDPWMDGPMEQMDPWMDGPERSRRENQKEDGSKRRIWNFWEGDWMSEPIMEEPKRKAAEEDTESSMNEENIEASISPLAEQPRPKRMKRLRAKRK